MGEGERQIANSQYAEDDAAGQTRPEVYHSPPPQQHSQPSPDYIDRVVAQHKAAHRTRRVLSRTFMIVLLAAILAGGVYYFLAHKAAQPAKTNHQSSQNAAAANPNAPQKYNSSNFNLSFEYPGNWTVADKGNGKLTVTSPSMQLTDMAGQKQTGKIIFNVEKQASADLSGFSTGDGQAVLKSTKVEYAHPARTQRADTYISFVQYNTATIKGTLDGIYVTGNMGYTKAQLVPESDVTQNDPLVRVTFVQCANPQCSGKTAPLRISIKNWGNKDFSQPIISIIESLRIQ